MICGPCLKTHTAHPHCSPKKEQRLAAGLFSLFFAGPFFFGWQSKGQQKSGPLRERTEGRISSGNLGKKKKKKNQNYELHFKSVSLRIFDVYKFNVVLHFFLSSFFSFILKIMRILPLTLFLP